MAKDRSRRVDKARDGLRFVALPHVVLQSPGWRQAGHVARSLLVDVASQYDGKNNGRLVACAKFLKPLGWSSHDVVTRALRELVACGLLVETRKGARPNRAAWFAITWYALDVREGLEITPSLYRTGGYRTPDTRPPKNAALIPPHGIGHKEIAPPHGVRASTATP